LLHTPHCQCWKNPPFPGEESRFRMAHLHLSGFPSQQHQSGLPWETSSARRAYPSNKRFQCQLWHAQCWFWKYPNSTISKKRFTFLF
jgi:hypothetical protein